MSLFQKFMEVKDWKYYSMMPVQHYGQAIQLPVQFIREYFGFGGKADFLLNSVYSRNEERARHVVNTYFLGLFLQTKLQFLKPYSSDLQANRHFLWAWFLCALYHDAFFDVAEVNEPIDYGFCTFSNKFLYSSTTIKNYFEKNRNTATSYDGKIHLDHGVLAASQLYRNYIRTLQAAVAYSDTYLLDFFTEQGVLIGGHLKINYKTFYSLCKVAKVIACHNIYVSSVGEQEKYRACKLHHLIPGNAKFHKMPHEQNYLRNDYEKLYYLLCLTDLLEPSKRGLSLHNIDFDICFNGEKYIIDILGANDEYLKTVREAADWLTGINIFQDGQRIEIAMQRERFNGFIAPYMYFGQW